MAHCKGLSFWMCKSFKYWEISINLYNPSIPDAWAFEDLPPYSCHQAMGGGSGAFIVFEGTEKVGKLTQSKKLAEALQQISGQETLLITFPDTTTPVGKMIERYQAGEIDLEPHAAHMLFIANRWERQSDISAALRAGRHVIVDQYSYSSTVITAAKINPLPLVDWQWFRTVDTGLLQPNIVFCLVAEDPDEMRTRDAYSSDRFHSANFQGRVSLYYARLAQEIEAERASEENEPKKDAPATNGSKSGDGSEKNKFWNWIQATGQSIDDVHNCIMALVDPFI